MKTTIGGDRLGSGGKMQVDLKNYNRSTHDLGSILRTTMSAGTLVPFMKLVGLPGDTFDIDLDVDVKTHPTIGPLFGSYKVQLDVFKVPVRLYQSGLHNNALEIGMRMKDVKLPQMRVPAQNIDTSGDMTVTNKQVETLANNPSSLISYLGVVGAQIRNNPDEGARDFNAIPYLAYWDIYKNYYANKQEEIGMFINAKQAVPQIGTIYYAETATNLPQEPATTATPVPFNEVTELHIQFNFVTGRLPNLSDANDLYIGIDLGGTEPFYQKITTHFQTFEIQETNLLVATNPKITEWTNSVVNWKYIPSTDLAAATIDEFPLVNIDTMRENILASGKYEQFIINNSSLSPYGDSLKKLNDVDTYSFTASQYSQQGLALKTYQSDLFNNWMSNEWVDNASTGINAITAVDTSGGSFTLDALNLAGKVYDMLNRIAISGGTYQDWIKTVYTHDYINRTESPVYEGGLSRELVFQEVVSTAESELSEGNTQPLGTLAGKGVMSGKKKGGKLVVKLDEHSYIMGIASLTPRIDYSQGNDWDVNLKTMDDFHKPALDEIGFQDLITEQMAWWTTDRAGGELIQKSAGKQPAWINYMTAINKAKGNFALTDNQMFMTLNRRYEITGVEQAADEWTYNIKDLTTYIDPSKFNFIFADTDITSQNFWVQIGMDITARRKMSAKIMPNL